MTEFKEVENDLKADIANAIKCNFDYLLCHFIYLVLDEGDDRKKTLEDLQCKIEEQRYTDGDKGVWNCREEMVSDDVRADVEELKFIRKRDEIFAGCRDGLLREILNIANGGLLMDTLKDSKTLDLIHV